MFCQRVDTFSFLTGFLLALRFDLLQLPGCRFPQVWAACVQRLVGAKLAVDRVLVGVPSLGVAPE